MAGKSALAALLACAATQRAFPAPMATQEQVLQQVVERFTQAQVGFEPSVLRDLTASEYIEVSPLGEVDLREKMLGFYAAENKVEAPAATVSEFNVRVLGETAVVIAKVTFEMKGTAANMPTHALRETFVARQTPNGWKLVSAQYTAVQTKH